MDPFQVEMDDKIYGISSGASLPFNKESNIIIYELSGTAAKEAFMSDRLRKNEQFFCANQKVEQ